MRRLRLVTDGGGAALVPPAAPAPPSSDGMNLEARVLVQRLADRLLGIQAPDVPLPQGRVIVAVFDADALPELAGLLYQGRAARPQGDA